MTVFLDTVGLLALWDESDQWHKAAHASFVQIIDSKAALVTSSHVLAECGNAAARKPYRAAVIQLRQQMENGKRVIFPTAEDWEAAWKTYNNNSPSGAGIVDHLSFIVMRRIGVSKVFTNDRHFRAAGFETLF